MPRDNVTESDLLVRKGLPPDTPRIIVPSEAYTALLTAARTQSPQETAGGLIGIVTCRNGRKTVKIEEIRPISLAGRGVGLFPDMGQWEALRASLEEDATQRPGGKLCLAGWYFADPGLGLFPSRVDLISAHQALSPDGGLFLLVNPATQVGGFFLWQAGDPAPIGGFYERLPNRLVESIITWSTVLTRVPCTIQTDSRAALDRSRTIPTLGNTKRTPESTRAVELPGTAGAGPDPAGGLQNENATQSAAASVGVAVGARQRGSPAGPMVALAQPLSHTQGETPSPRMGAPVLVVRAVVALALAAGLFVAIFFHAPRTLPAAVAGGTMTAPAASAMLRALQVSAMPVASVTPVPMRQPTQRILTATPVASTVVPLSPAAASATSTLAAMPPGPDATDPAGLGRALVGKLAAAVAGLRTGQIDAVSAPGQVRRSTARLIFDLGAARNPPRLYFLSTYESGKSSQTVERVSVGNQTWERQTSGAWVAIGLQEAPWGQVQAFVPQAASITGPDGARDGRIAVLRWYDAGIDADSVLQFDYPTGALQTWLQHTRATGTTLTVTYTAWNTPVNIPTPDR